MLAVSRNATLAAYAVVTLHSPVLVGRRSPLVFSLNQGSKNLNVHLTPPSNN